MEAYSNSYSSSKSSYLTQNHEAKYLKNSADSINQSHAFLHSVRKSQTKPKKAPVAPPPPTPVKVYKVHPMNFRDLVQELTGAPEFKPQLQNQLLQSVAPKTSSPAASPPKPMLSGRDIAAASSKTVSTNWYLGGGDLKHWK